MKSVIYIVIFALAAIGITVVAVVGAYLFIDGSSERDSTESARLSESRGDETDTPPAETTTQPVDDRPVSLDLAAGQRGVLEHDGGVRVDIPRGTVDESVTVSISEVEPPSTSLPSGVELGRVFDISIGQAALSRPVTIHIPYEAQDGTTPEDVRALHWVEEEEQWEILEGEVDEAAGEVRVEVSELSWFTTIVRDVIGLFDYTSEDAYIESCAVSPDEVRPNGEFSIAANVNNHAVEDRMYVEMLVEGETRGVVWKGESDSAQVDLGDERNFKVARRLLSTGEHDVQCVLRSGIPEREVKEKFIPASWGEALAFFDGQGPELHRIDANNLQIEGNFNNSRATAKLAECSASEEQDGEFTLTAKPSGLARVGDLSSLNYKVGFLVYHGGEEVYKEVSDPKQKHATSGQFSSLEEPWTARYEAEGPGQYTLDCVLVGYALEFRERSLAYEIVAAIQDPLGAGDALGHLIRKHSVSLQWYDSTDFNWPTTAAKMAPTATPVPAVAAPPTAPRPIATPLPGPTILTPQPRLGHIVQEDFSDSLDTDRWFLYGSARHLQPEGIIELTPARNIQLGILLDRQPVSTAGLRVNFSFEIREGSGADGLGFLLLRSMPDFDRIHHRWGGVWVSHHLEGFLVAFDTHRNRSGPHGERYFPVDDPSSNFVALAELGAGSQEWDISHLATRNLSVPLRNSGMFDVDVEFTEDGRVTVYLSNAEAGMDRTLVIEHNIDDLTPFDGYVGFLAATGDLTDRHILRSVRYESASVTGTAAPATPAPTAPAPATAKATVYRQLLAMIPDRWTCDGATREVFINDYAAIREAFDLHLTGVSYHDEWDGKRGDDFPFVFNDVNLGPFHIYSGERDREFNWNLRYFAFDYGDMDQSILLDGCPPGVTEIILGQFDSQLTHEALMTCSECHSPSIQEHKGLRFYSWGDDDDSNLRMRLAPPAFDSLGRGGRIAVSDSFLLRASSTDEVEAMIDASLNDDPSLADVEAFRVLANAMSRFEGVYFSWLSEDARRYRIEDIDEICPLAPSPAPPPAPPKVASNDKTERVSDYENRLREFTKGPWLAPFDALAIGQGKDEGGAYAAIALLHDDEQSAEVNAGLLRKIIEERPMPCSGDVGMRRSDFIELDRSQIRVEGRVLLSILRSEANLIPYHLLRNVNQGDSILLYKR